MNFREQSYPAENILTSEEIQKLEKLREEIQKYRMRYTLAQRHRLNFMRWLVATGMLKGDTL